MPKERPQYQKKNTPVVIIITFTLLACLAVITEWKISGSSLPLHISQPRSPETRSRLRELFPNTKETTINSMMMRCYQRNYIDTSGTYEEFIEYFHSEKELNVYIKEGTCPKEGHRF